MMDKLQNFPNQITDGDFQECVALTTCDLAGNILGRQFSNDFTYAATIFLEGVPPGDQGTDPWTALQSACAYGLLPLENAPFTAKTKGELYTSNWANYDAATRKLALEHQLVAPINIGLSYDAMVSFMRNRQQGVMLPVTWFSSFTSAGFGNRVTKNPDGTYTTSWGGTPTDVLSTPAGSVTNHCIAAYLDTDNTTVLIKPWLGTLWGRGGYGVLTKEMFNTIVQDVYSFDQAGNHWYTILAILLTKFPFLADKLPSLFSAGDSVTDPDFLYQDWSVIKNAHHNVRALCDLEGLNWSQKQILTACVSIESSFYINAIHHNTNGKGTIVSTDYGIVQVNDYWHIGEGKDFLTVEYVLTHPEECVRWMAKYYKVHGNLNAWCSFTSGAYLRALNKV